MEQTQLSDLRVDGILTAAILYSEKGMTMKRRHRNAWAVILKFEGQTVYRTEHGEYISDITHPVVLPCGSSYEWTCTEGGSYFTVEFSANSESRDIYPFAIPNPDELMRLMNHIERSRRLKKSHSYFSSMSDMYAILALLARSETKRYTSPKSNLKISASVDYINSNFDRKLTNDEIAAQSGVSTVYFRKLFSECYGMSPIRYQHKLRIDRAKEMLNGEYGSVKAIADALGYSSIAHFCSAFHSYTGVSPKQYAADGCYSAGAVT